MATKTEQRTILLISKSILLIDETRAAISKMESLKLVEKDVTLENLFAIIEETKPDVILFDYEFQINPSALLKKITSEFEKYPVIVVLPEFNMTDSEQVIAFGARAYIGYPYQADSLIVTIKRVLDLKVRKDDYLIRIPALDEEKKPSNTFTVFSPKGGVGTTTLAVNLAISMQKQLKEEVLLIDGKHLFGHLALYMNLRTGNSIIDLVAHANMLDEQLIRQVVVRHSSGVYVLPSPNSVMDGQGIRPEDLFKVIQGLQQIFRCIIIDAGNFLNENTVTYMDSSEKILVVLNPDLASLRDIKQFMQVATTLSYPKDKLALILNLTGRKMNVKREEIENILKVKIFGKIPSDDNLALGCLNEGIPIILKKPRHPISEAINEIAKDLAKSILTSISD